MKVLLADHHPVFRRGLKSILARDSSFKFKGKVENGADLLPAIEKYNPDLVILELDLPDAHGVAILRTVKDIYPSLKILVVSCHPEEIYALSAIKAGAHGYISKTQPVAAVKKALLRVARGETYLSEGIQANLKSSTKQSNQLRFKKLSIREIEVLNLLSSGKRNKEISRNLNINEKTVSTYKTRLLKKLQVDNVVDLVHQSRLLQLTK